MDSSISGNAEDKLELRSKIPQKGGENVGGAGHDISCEITDPSPESTFPIFSSRKTSMEDLTARGMETRIGVPKEYLSCFAIKELIENCVDCHETHQRNLGNDKDPVPRVRVQIFKESDLVRILVRNSNPYPHSQDIFTKEKLRRIFDLDRYYSSKRYQFRISRGALGDALKEVLRIPYILATEGQEHKVITTDWKEPLIIRTAQKVFHVILHVDRVKQSRRSEVKEYQEQNICNDCEKFTEVEFRIPANSLDLVVLKRFLIDYATAIPHIDFTFIDEDDKISHFHQVQSIERNWTNMCSIYYYTPHEFTEFILGLEDDGMIVHRVLRSVFREGSNMKKTELTSISIGQLKHNPALIQQLYEHLRDTNLNHLGPISDPSNLSLPFNTNKKVRVEAIKERFEQRGLKINSLKYKSQFGYHKDEKTGVEFPFFYEIAVAQTSNLPYYLSYLESLNSSIMPGGYSFTYGPEGTFRWETRSKKYFHESRSIFPMLEHCGYSHDGKKCKKPRTLIFANLVSPKINYKSYGKSSIDLRPFTSVIAETTVKQQLTIMQFV